MENIFLDFYNKIRHFKKLGTKDAKFAKLIGKAPHIGTEAWLHSIYKPITEEEIFKMNNELRINIPKVYEDFLLVCNGLSVFGTTLSLFGYRYNYKRDLENVWQPFDIIKMNNYEKPQDAKENHFFFGFYDWDGSKLYMDTNSFKIYRCSKTSVIPLTKWESFESMLLLEIDRLLKLFDENGVEIDDKKETIPLHVSL